ncbi:uncharacterized protein LOC116194045 [Punica granatum]|uniref:Uncharacterized protein LOC116194045 n=1 Tax=Punica granatum TaxID=22663 RepID=A0A218WSP3_PUNGR|nr:uncharacterized protein LOC116194045 [Punica granatum]OWM75519.1 hypothetical protein CDL15_Pgr021683 [Punica granatum]
MFFAIPRFPLLDSALDLASLSLLLVLLLLSSLSFFFIFHLRLKSRTAPHLKGFNSLWTVKLLLVSSITLWALDQVQRTPFFRRRYLYPNPLPPNRQADICRLHSVLSLGLFEPAFLITLLFLVNVSIKKRNPQAIWAVAFVLGICLPLASIQSFFTYFSPVGQQLPEYFFRSSVQFKDAFGNDTVLCTNPLLGTVIFGAFAITYCLCFLLSCWKVVSLVINKGLRARIYGLVIGVLVPLPIQVVLLIISAFSAPQKPAFGGIAFGILAGPLVCAAVGEAILVLNPITDALAVGGDCCRWSPKPEEGKGSTVGP